MQFDLKKIVDDSQNYSSEVNSYSIKEQIEIHQQNIKILDELLSYAEKILRKHSSTEK